MGVNAVRKTTATRSEDSWPRLQERSPESWWSRSAMTGLTYPRQPAGTARRRTLCAGAYIAEPTVVPDADDVHLRPIGDSRLGIPYKISSANSDFGIGAPGMGTVTDLPGENGGKRFEIAARFGVPVEIYPDTDTQPARASTLYGTRSRSRTIRRWARLPDFGIGSNGHSPGPAPTTCVLSGGRKCGDLRRPAKRLRPSGAIEGCSAPSSLPASRHRLPWE